VTGPRREARIDLAALTRNLIALGAESLDIRANAYGHGADVVEATARAAGVTSFSPTGIGAGAYGLDPTASTAPVLTLVGEVVAVKRVPAGSGVSYGYSYRTGVETVLALVALGYADGVPRLASNRASVWIAGAARPLVGRVAMDQFVVECGSAEPEVGEDAVLFGAGSGVPTAADWAGITGRTPLELTAGLGPRIVRRDG
jgi:alanine racemase